MKVLDYYCNCNVKLNLKWWQYATVHLGDVMPQENMSKHALVVFVAHSDHMWSQSILYALCTFTLVFTLWFYLRFILHDT